MGTALRDLPDGVSQDRTVPPGHVVARLTGKCARVLPIRGRALQLSFGKPGAGRVDDGRTQAGCRGGRGGSAAHKNGAEKVFWRLASKLASRRRAARAHICIFVFHWLKSELEA